MVNALESISCHNFIVADGYAYFSSWTYNGWYKVEIETGKTIFLGYFKNEKLSQWNIHKEIFLKDDKIYVCPWKGRHVHIWNLTDQTVCSIEIRRKEEDFFSIEEVVIGEGCLFFLPDRKYIPARRMDLESLTVSIEKNEIYGVPISETKDIFPAPKLLEKYQIEHTDKFFWKRIFHKTWYAFLPLRHHLLRYIEETDSLEILPLAVVNEKELDRYLQKIETELFNENPGRENSVIKLPEFFKKIKTVETHKTDADEANTNIGKQIWKQIGTDVNRFMH